MAPYGQADDKGSVGRLGMGYLLVLRKRGGASAKPINRIISAMRHKRQTPRVNLLLVPACQVGISQRRSDVFVVPMSGGGGFGADEMKRWSSHAEQDAVFFLHAPPIEEAKNSS